MVAGVSVALGVLLVVVVIVVVIVITVMHGDEEEKQGLRTAAVSEGSCIHEWCEQW